MYSSKMRIPKPKEKEKNQNWSGRKTELPMVSVLLIVDDQKLVADEIEHNQSDHHQDSKQ